MVKLQLPEPSIVAAPRSVAPSNKCTETDERPLGSLTVPDSVGVASLVTPPPVIVGTAPESVLIVGLMVTLGGVGGVSITGGT